MLLEKLMPENISADGFETMQSTVSRMHNIELIKSENIGDPREPDASILHIRVDNAVVLLRLERNEDGKWGRYLFDEARLATPEGKEIKGDAGKVPEATLALLRTYIPQPSVKDRAQPRP